MNNRKPDYSYNHYSPVHVLGENSFLLYLNALMFSVFFFSSTTLHTSVTPTAKWPTPCVRSLKTTIWDNFQAGAAEVVVAAARKREGERHLHQLPRVRNEV